MVEVFEETTLAGVTLKNRIIRSATHEGLSDESGMPNEKLIKKYEQLANGGVGAIITGYVGVMQNGKSPVVSMGMIDCDENIPAFKIAVDRIHALNTPIFLQIAHCGRQTRSKITGYPTVAPSAIRDGLYNEDHPHELRDSEIIEVIDHFVAAVQRAKKAGFDGIQLHLAHGYLLSSFLSPHMNKRKDKWGGSIHNRFRIIHEIMIRSRKTVGDYPILAKINAFEKSSDGMKTSEAIKISKLLEKYGCDGIEVSSGIVEDGFWTTRGQFPFEIIKKDNFRIKNMPAILHPIVKLYLKKRMESPFPYNLYNLESAKVIKNAVKIPVIVVGGIRSLDEIKSIVETGDCDFVSMARPFITEPDLVNKMKTGLQLASKCINCNYCIIGIEARPLKCYYGRLPKELTGKK